MASGANQGGWRWILKGLRLHQRLTSLPAPPAKPPVLVPSLMPARKPVPRHRGLLIGAVTLVVGLGFAGWQNRDGIAGWFAAPPASVLAAAPPAPAAPLPPSPAPADMVPDAPPAKPRTIAAQRAELLRPGGVIWVRRAGSVLREAQKPSAKALDKLPKGAAVTVLALDGPWTQVRHGGVAGWMRTSVLGPDPGD